MGVTGSHAHIIGRGTANTPPTGLKFSAKVDRLITGSNYVGVTGSHAHIIGRGTANTPPTGLKFSAKGDFSPFGCYFYEVLFVVNYVHEHCIPLGHVHFARPLPRIWGLIMPDFAMPLCGH